MDRARSAGLSPNAKEKGQAVIEAVLLSIVLLGAVLLVSRYFQQEELIRRIVSGPWQNLSGMIQNGVWAPPRISMKMHPNLHIRHVSLKGDDAK